jgi:hypothetical protein
MDLSNLRHGLSPGHRNTASIKECIMFKYATIAALLAAAAAVPAQARGWLPTPATSSTQATTNASTVPFSQAGKGLLIVSAKERAAQQSWWAMRAERGAERRMAACAAMPDCKDVHKASTANS